MLPIFTILFFWIFSSDEGFDPFNFFVKKTTTTEKSTTVSYPDPTAIEFRKIFGSIVEHSLSKPDRNLVIVIDNLDRMNSEKSLEVWSSLLAFLNQHNLNQFESKEKLWVITPFDFKKLSEIISRNGQSNLNEFIDKTFQVVLRVSKPVLIDWKEFLGNKLGESFTDIDEQEIHRIFRLYQIIRVQNQLKGLPTPRELIRYVNDLSGLYRRWEGDIPLVLLSFYNLISQEITNSPEPRNALNEYRNSNIISLLKDDEWEKKIFAVHYNVSPDKAHHILLTDPILEAISNSNKDQLKKLSKSQGFYEILENIIDREISLEEIGIFNNTLIVLEILGEPKGPSHKNCWDSLKNKLLNTQRLPHLNESLGIGFNNLIVFSGGQDQTLINKIIELFTNYELSESYEETELYSYGDSIIKIIEKLIEIDKVNFITQLFTVPFDDHEYIKLIGYLSEGYEESFIRYLQTELTTDEIVYELRRKLSENILGYDDARVIYLLNKINGFSNADWNGFIDLADSKINSNNNSFSGRFLGSMIESLVHIKNSYPDSNVEVCFQDNNKNANLLNKYYSSRDDIICSARIILSQLLFNPSISISNTGNAQNGKKEIVNFLNNPVNEEVFGELKQLIKFSDSLTHLLDVYIDYEYDVIKKIANDLVSESDAYKYVTSVLFIENFDKWKTILSEDNLKDFANNQINFNDLIKIIIEKDSFEVDSHELVDISLRYAPKEIQKPQLIKYVNNKIEELTEDEWFDVFEDETYLLDSLEFLYQINQFPKLTEEFDKALSEYHQELCRGNVIIPEKARIFQIIGSSRYGEEEFVNLLLTTLKESKENDLTKFLETYSKFLINSDDFVKHSNLIVGNIFVQMLNDVNRNELLWINRAFDQTDIFSKTKLAPKRRFTDKLREQFYEGGHPGDINDLLTKISKSAGFELDNTSKY